MSGLTGFIPAFWKRALLRRIQFADAHSRLNLLYALPDPWGMDQELEQFRFRETNAFLRKHVEQIDTLLEIGCGEGHQTLALLKLARHITGVDVSSVAIQRAKLRVPQAHFIAGDILTLPELAAGRMFDVATACEVLYYVKDPQTYVAKLESLSRWVLATYVDKHRKALDPLIKSKPGLTTSEIRFENVTWSLALWRGNVGQ